MQKYHFIYTFQTNKDKEVLNIQTKPSHLE